MSNLEIQKLELIQLILGLQDGSVLGKIEDLLHQNGVFFSQMPMLQPIRKTKKTRKYGFAKGKTLFIAPDFDETPAGFEEYMLAQ